MTTSRARTSIRGSTLLLAGRVLSMGINFVVQVLIVRALSKTDYGAFAYALSIATLGANIATFGLDRAVTRFIPVYEERGQYPKLTGTVVMVIGTIIGVGAAMILVLYGFRGALTGTLIDEPQAIAVLLILAFLAPVQALDDLTIGLFAVFSKPRAIFVRKYVLAPGLRLGVVLLAIGVGAEVRFIAAGYVAAGAAGLVVYAVLLVRVLRERGVWARMRLHTMQLPYREILGFTLPLLTTDLVFTAMNTSDVLLLGRFRDAVAVGALRVIQPVARLNQLALGVFALLFTPVLARLYAREERGELADVYADTSAWLAVVSFPILAVCVALARPLTVLLYGQRYEASAPFLALLAVGYYVNAVTGLNGVTLQVFRRVRFLVVVNICAVAVNIGANVLLIPRFGAIGAVWGTLATLVAYNALKQWGLRRTADIRLFAPGRRRVYAAVVGGAGAVAGAVQLIGSPLIVGLVGSGLATLLVLFVARRTLRISDTFPELTRIPGGRLLFGASAQDEDDRDA